MSLGVKRAVRRSGCIMHHINLPCEAGRKAACWISGRGFSSLPTSVSPIRPPQNSTALCIQCSLHCGPLQPPNLTRHRIPRPSSYTLLGPKYPLLGTIYPQLRVQGGSWYPGKHEGSLLDSGAKYADRSGSEDPTPEALSPKPYLDPKSM